MVSVNPPAQEPTPEFNQACMGVIKTWEAGDLPFNEAITRLTLLGQQATKDGHIVNQGRTEQLLAYLQHYRGNLDASILHNDRARTLYTKARNSRRVATIDMNQGENYRFKGDYAKALHLYQSAQKTAEQTNDFKTYTICTLNIGLVMVRLKRHEEALNYLLKAVELVHQNPSEFEPDAVGGIQSEAHNGIAVVYLQSGQLEDAWKHAKEALALARHSREFIMKGNANRTMGEIIAELGIVPEEGFSDDPDDYFRASLDAFHELNAEAEIARTMYSQAISLAKRGKRNNAARKLQHVMTMFMRLGMVDDAARAAQAQLNVL